MAKIKDEKTIMYDFLMKIGPKNWTLCCEEKRMLGIISNNYSESFNNMISHYRTLNPLQLLHGLSFLIDTMISKGRAKIIKEINRIEHNEREQANFPEFIVKRVKNHINLSKTHKTILASNGKQYYVTSQDFLTRIVNIFDWNCSCCYTDQFGIPCSHLCGVLVLRGQDPFSHIDSVYRLDNIEMAYKGYVNLVDLSTLSIETNNIAALEKPRPGRKKTPKRLRSQGELPITKNQRKCSKCLQLGHYRKRCPNTAVIH